MTWKPISRDELNVLILNSYSEMSDNEKAFWNHIKIDLRKWNALPWSKEGKGFWVVGLFGQNVLWYNDIEEGFNLSQYSEYGEIRQYLCKQTSLQQVIHSLVGC